MRRVSGTYQEFVPSTEDHSGYWNTIEFEGGFFHQWGVSSEELEVGALVDTMAIVELPDGQIITTTPCSIRFTDPVMPSLPDHEGKPYE